MYKFKELTNVLGYTYLDRFYEKMAYRLSENRNSDVSALETLSILADEMSFSDDGCLYSIIENDFSITELDDIHFRLEYVKKDDNYVLFIDNKIFGTCDSLSSVVKDCVEDFFV